MSANYWADKPIHRLLVYTEHGLTPEVVEEFFSSVECGEVVDPFVGSGTVGVEALRRGWRFLGIDSNPAAVVLTAAKVSPEALVSLRPLPQLERYHGAYYETLMRLSRRVRTALDAGAFFNTARRFSIFRFSPAPKLRGGAVDGDPVAYFNSVRRLALRDVKLLRGARGDVVWGDSTFWLPRRVCAVLTSPPFANNVDYGRHTMIENMWLGHPPSRIRDMQLPACEAAARSWKNSIEIGLEIGGKRARGYRRFLGQYLYYMSRHIQLLAERLEAEAWYTIGDSYLGGAYVPVHKMLAKIAEEADLRTYVRPLGERPMKRGRVLYLLRLVKRR
ncbi:MAG: DNA adenine methylase [Thermoproteus sp.]